MWLILPELFTTWNNYDWYCLNCSKSETNMTDIAWTVQCLREIWLILPELFKVWNKYDWYFLNCSKSKRNITDIAWTADNLRDIWLILPELFNVWEKYDWYCLNCWQSERYMTDIAWTANNRFIVYMYMICATVCIWVRFCNWNWCWAYIASNNHLCHLIVMISIPDSILFHKFWGNTLLCVLMDDFL